MIYQERESIEHPGFYHPYSIEEVVVSRDGRVIELISGKILEIRVKNHGYLSIEIRRQKEGEVTYKQYLLHRLLGLAFMPIPDEFKDLPLRKVQVNHKDGNKVNNALDNLEWCVAKTNMRHAFKNKLIAIGTNVLARNILTNEVRSYPSLKECVKHHDISHSSLKRHLRSGMAGRKTCEWFVFKQDDGSDWPQIDPNKHIESSWHLTDLVLAEKKGVEKKFLFSSLKQAAEMLNLNYRAVKQREVIQGKRDFYEWTFQEIDLSEAVDISGLKFERRRFGRESEKTFHVIDKRTGISAFYIGGEAVGKAIDYDAGYIVTEVSKGKNDFGHYIVRESADQGQRGLVHSRV